MFVVDPGNVAYFLAERRLLAFDSVVDGDFMVVDQTSRNRNLKVVRRKSPGFFIKQVSYPSPEYTQTLAREAACYRLANGHPEFGAMRALMPEFHHFDPARHVLVVELLDDAESLWEYHQRAHSFPTEVAKLQGRTLGSYHGQVKAEAAQQGAPGVFPGQIPWILSLHETNPAYLGTVSRGNAQLIAILQQYPEFESALSGIKAGWNYSSLIHGDIKWENMMLCHGGGDPAPRLKIIDWEIADIGDECWDVGAVIQAYVTFWIFSLPLSGGASIAEAVAAAPLDAESMKPALAAYWNAYAEGRGLGADASRAMLLRSMNCAAARMIQTAYESIQATPQISPYALCKLQVSMNILHDPEAAVAEFVGL
ncbi:MAG TPA: phosphotransferase [Pyrinomonadaceae bacterium]|jgi:thiamine kinase-like enzyme|nr:phosphotransferase [Pyrinomonadaceae bacterium]